MKSMNDIGRKGKHKSQSLQLEILDCWREEGGSFTFITSWESSQGSVWPLGMSHVYAPGEDYRFGGTLGELVSRQ